MVLQAMVVNTKKSIITIPLEYFLSGGTIFSRNITTSQLFVEGK